MSRCIESVLCKCIYWPSPSSEEAIEILKRLGTNRCRTLRRASFFFRNIAFQNCLLYMLFVCASCAPISGLAMTTDSLHPLI